MSWRGSYNRKPLSYGKRKREYTENTYANFKVNEFLDYMMVASEEEKDMVLEYFTKHYGAQKRAWNWVVYGEVLEVSYIDSETNTTQTSKCFDRLCTKDDVPQEIIHSPWLKTEREKETYAHADSTFWYLIFTRLTSVDAVVSFSQVSRVHRHVARKQGAYTPWIRAFMASRVFYNNPFQDKPEWVQFLYLAGVPRELWKQLVQNDTACWFMAVACCGGYGVMPITEEDRYDVEQKVIRLRRERVVPHPTDPTFFISSAIWRDPVYYSFRQHRNQTSMMDRIMEKKRI